MRCLRVGEPGVVTHLADAPKKETTRQQSRPGTSRKCIFPKCILERLSALCDSDLTGTARDCEIQMQNSDEVLSKVPEITLGFWIIKILATTLGETGGDLITMGWLHADQNAQNGGYLIGTAIFLAVFVAAVIVQISMRRFNAWIYWLAIVASTTVGTAMADLFDRSLGVGYTGGSSILLACVLCSLAAWYLALGSVNVQTVATPKVEAFYWMTITFSQTLGTALGDWVADAGLGYEGGALVFGAGLAVLVAAYYWTNISRVVLFWAAFILTRPLGATVGDFLDKPVSQGGLHLSRPFASAVLAACILACLLLLPQRAGRHPAATASST
jgi:uncharacterized membrane-anchored protein